MGGVRYGERHLENPSDYAPISEPRRRMGRVDRIFDCLTHVLSLTLLSLPELPRAALPVLLASLPSCAPWSSDAGLQWDGPAHSPVPAPPRSAGASLSAGLARPGPASPARALPAGPSDA